MTYLAVTRAQDTVRVKTNETLVAQMAIGPSSGRLIRVV